LKGAFFFFLSWPRVAIIGLFGESNYVFGFFAVGSASDIVVFGNISRFVLETKWLVHGFKGISTIECWCNGILFSSSTMQFDFCILYVVRI